MSTLASWKADAIRLQTENVNLSKEVERLREEVEGMRRDAERYRWLRKQHEIDDDQCSNVNYGKSYPPRTMTVFADDGDDGLEPIPCDPGELDAAIDRAKGEKE